MKVDMFDGILRWTQPEDDVIVEVDGYFLSVTGLEIDEQSGRLIIKAEYEDELEFSPDDDHDDDEEPTDPLESCAQEGGTICALPEPSEAKTDVTPQAKEA